MGNQRTKNLPRFQVSKNSFSTACNIIFKRNKEIKGGNFSWHFRLDIYKLATASCLLYQPTSTNPTTPKLISHTPSPSNHSNLSSHSIGSRFGLACSIRLWKPRSTANATVGAILALAFIPDFYAWSSHKVIVCVLSCSEGMKPWYRSLSSMNHTSIYLHIYVYNYIIYIYKHTCRTEVKTIYDSLNICLHIIYLCSRYCRL